MPPIQERRRNHESCYCYGKQIGLSRSRKSEAMLREFGVDYETRIISAHRTPKQAEGFAANAEANGFGTIIAAAGKAAHLAGVLAATHASSGHWTPMKSSTMDGLDSLLSVVQMPKGVPVATVAINGAENADLAVQILAAGDPALRQKIKDFKKRQEEEIIALDHEFQNQK